MMTSITALSLVALAITGLAFIHETRLRRVAHTMLRRLIEFRSCASKSHNRSHERA
jgi:hypothetical protein